MTEDPLRQALKAVAVALKRADVPFALAAGYAAWARGGPEPDHDVDFVVLPSVVNAAKKALSDAGLRVEQPTEDWLFKAYDRDAMVDLIHTMNGSPVSEEMLERSDEMDVLSVRMPVLSSTDVVIGKLLAMDEHFCDFAAVLPVARALREQVDWPLVERAVAGSAFARAFLRLSEDLGIVGIVSER